MWANKDREQLWQERLAEWKADEKKRRAYAIEHGFPVCQLTAALLPVHVAASMSPAPTAQGPAQ